MTEINNPQALSELTEAFQTYERALAAGDVEVLKNMFWDDLRTVRYGTRIAERQYGFEQIAGYRMSAKPPQGKATHTRSLQNTVVTTFGRDFGTANTEYRRSDSEAVGRQTQTWMRTADGWKIVSAHVSFGI